MNRHVVLLFIPLILLLISCNKDEPTITKTQVQQALAEMKGTYEGEASISYYHGSLIARDVTASAVSSDSLQFNMPLAHLAATIDDQIISSILLESAEVSVKAGYEFYQMAPDYFNFVLHPADVVINRSGKSIRIVFAQTFGGCGETYQNGIIFNISPSEIWVDGVKYDPFRQLVFNFMGQTKE